MALIEVRSVYDTDGLNRMGENMLAAVDLPPGCTVGIAKRTPLDAMDTRGEVPDLVRMKDPADAAYGCSPARFVRATRAVSPPSNAMGGREAIGETEFEQQQILGYAPVEPDGSFKLIVPADVPLALLDPRCQGSQHPDPPQLDPGAAGRASHLRRLPQPAPRRGDQLRHRRQRCAGGDHADARRRPPVGRDDGGAAHPARPDRARPEERPRLQRHLGRHLEAGRRRPRLDQRQVHRQRRIRPTTW